MSPSRLPGSSDVLPRPSRTVLPHAPPPAPARVLAARTAARAATAAPWATFLGACLVIMAVAAADDLAGATTWLPVAAFGLVGLSSVAATLYGVRRHRPNLARAWQLLAAALLVSTVAFALLELSDHAPAGTPLDRGLLAGVSDGVHLAVYPLLLAALLLLIHRQDPGRNWASIVDALVVATGAALLSWVFLIGPLARDPGLGLSDRMVALAYPTLDLLVLAVAVRLAVGLNVRTRAVMLLGVALLVLLAADSAHALDRLTGDRYGSLLVCQGWMLWSAAVGAAALHPSMRRLSEPPTGRGEVKLDTWRLALLAIASLTAPVALWVQWARGEPISVPAFSIGSAVLFLLVLARTGGLAREVAIQSGARKRLLDRTVQAREEERVRVAADLHDGPIQRLASLGYMVEVARLRVEREDTAGSQKLLASLREQLSDEVESLRRLMAELRPPVLDEWGLSAALSACAAQFERRAQITCAVEVKLRSRLDASQETVLYRVTQEALTNIRKHAGAANARIMLTTRDGRVELRITDDGVGFDVASIPDLLHREHYGLAGMRQRVEMAGGTCDVHSRPGQGTTVTVTLPR